MSVVRWLLACALVAIGALHAHAEIGTARAITVEVTGDAEGAPRKLKTGDEVFEDEQITTNAKGTGQFELLDRTRIAVGPRSTVKFDEFIYDKNRKASSVAIELGRGAFRFMSGRSESKAYTITTPTATLGVRGTAFDIYVAPDGEMAVAMIEGGIEVCPRGGACRLHNVIGRFLRLTPAGAFSLHERWDGTFLGGVTFGAALPFLAAQNVLVPAFRAKSSVTSRYAQAIPRAIEKTGKAIPNLLRPLKQLNPFH